jgi:hypothetical protein
MRRKLTIALLLAALVAALGSFAGCGGEDTGLEAVEGEPLELGELLYNVQITRFLNPSNRDDAAYLEGLEEAPSGQEYLAVFMRIGNEGSEPEQVPDTFIVKDSRDAKFEPLELDNPFALQFGAVIEPGGRLPAPDTPAASGPIKGSMVLFLIDQAATENRPLELEIPGPDGETGRIELDI